jgi:hypothetical protein
LLCRSYVTNIHVASGIELGSFTNPDGTLACNFERQAGIALNSSVVGGFGVIDQLTYSKSLDPPPTEAGLAPRSFRRLVFDKSQMKTQMPQQAILPQK